LVEPLVRHAREGGALSFLERNRSGIPAFAGMTKLRIGEIGDADFSTKPIAA
jgi:hypothetical protein